MENLRKEVTPLREENVELQRLLTETRAKLESERAAQSTTRDEMVRGRTTQRSGRRTPPFPTLAL